MMFLLRCIFWLGLVYAHIDWPHGGFFAALFHDGAAIAQERVTAAAGDAPAQCLASPKQCLEVAEKLHRLTQAQPKANHDTLTPRDRQS